MLLVRWLIWRVAFFSFRQCETLRGGQESVFVQDLKMESASGERNIFARLKIDFSKLFPPNRRISFKSQEDNWELSRKVLSEYFGLHSLEAPTSSLCPTIPNRMEYVCVMKQMEQITRLIAPEALGSSEEGKVIRGIDIGTGYTGIYALLAAKVYGFAIDAIETCKEASDTAARNVESNSLAQLVTVHHSGEANSIFPSFLKYNHLFCMCNPPFYASEQEWKQPFTCKATAPHSQITGHLNEMVCTKGGELAFIQQMLQESQQPFMQKRIVWYSCMVSKKATLRSLDTSQVACWLEVEFCFASGGTRRWIALWTWWKQFSDFKMTDVKCIFVHGKRKGEVQEKLVRKLKEIDLWSGNADNEVIESDRIVVCIEQVTWNRAYRRGKRIKPLQEAAFEVAIAVEETFDAHSIISICPLTASSSTKSPANLSNSQTFNSFYLHLQHTFTKESDLFIPTSNL